MRLSKCKLKALEKVFGAEIEGRLPFQARGKVYQALCNEGLLAEMSRVLEGPPSLPLPICVSGYQLTHAGRLIYCESCRDVADEGLA